jgi:hypothetical protein
VKLAVAQFDSDDARTRRIAGLRRREFDQLGEPGVAAAQKHISAKRSSDVAVQRYVDRPADDDGDKPTMLALINPECPGLRLRVADTGYGLVLPLLVPLAQA